MFRKKTDGDGKKTDETVNDSITPEASDNVDSEELENTDISTPPIEDEPADLPTYPKSNSKALSQKVKKELGIPGAKKTLVYISDSEFEVIKSAYPDAKPTDASEQEVRQIVKALITKTFTVIAVRKWYFADNLVFLHAVIKGNKGFRTRRFMYKLDYEE